MAWAYSETPYEIFCPSASKYLSGTYVYSVCLLLYWIFFKTAEPVPVIHAALLIGKSYKDNTVSAG